MPWLRAPVLLRAPGVLLAVALSAAVLAVASGSGALFLASATTGSLHSSASSECAQRSQPAISNSRTARQMPTSQQSPRRVQLARPVVSAVLTGRGLPAPDMVATSQVGLPTGSDSNFSLATLFARTGALNHVDVVTSAGGSGVWVPQRFAAASHIRAGMSLPIGTSALRVAGVYRDLAPSGFVPLFAVPRYWCSWSAQIVPTPFNRPPPLFLTDLTSLESVSTLIDATWFVPGSVTGFTVPQAQSRLDATSAALADLTHRTFSDYRAVSDLPDMIAKAHRVHAGLRGAVVPIEVAGIVVALMLVAGSGQYWALRRRSEISLLTSRGVPATALGCKAVLEVAPAVTAGTVLGWLAAIGLTQRLGPSALLDPGAPALALKLVAASAGLALLVVAAIGTFAARTELRPMSQARWLIAVPWELSLVVAAGVTYWLVRRNGAVHVVKATVQINSAVFTFPLLALAGAIVLIARGSNGLLRPLARAARMLPPAGYLAMRRMAGTPAVAMGVIVGTALPCGMLLYSSALTGATSADVQAKYQTNVGADDAFGTLATPGTSPKLGGHATIVSVFQSDVDTTTGSGAQIQVLGVDPAGFTQFAHQGRTLRPLVDRLSSARGTGPPPALLINAPLSLKVSSLHLRHTTVPVTVIARRASFPGLRDGFLPMIVLNRAALRHVDPLAERVEELWTTSAQVTPALAALRADGVDANYQISTDTFLDSSGLRPVTWIFNYLRALALLTGLVAVTGLTLALAGRTRQQALAYHMARRMGLGRAQNLRSLCVELGTLIGLGCGAGFAVASGAVASVYHLVDLYRDLPPPPAYPVPITAAVAIALATAVLTIVGALSLQRLYERSTPSALLRQ